MKSTRRGTVESAGEVGEEDEGAAQHADQQNLAAVSVVVGDAVRQDVDTREDLGLRENDLRCLRLCHRALLRPFAVPNLCASDVRREYPCG